MSAKLEQYALWSRKPIWRPDTPQSIALIPEQIRELVTDRGSLTQALLRIDQLSFKVNMLQQGIRTPFMHEQKKLARPFTLAALVREVELCLFDQAVVYARSIIPLSLLQQGSKGLAGLGQTPLGQVLFTDGRIRVSKREFLLDQCGIARRTPYDYQGQTILVSEFFLPALKQYL